MTIENLQVLRADSGMILTDGKEFGNVFTLGNGRTKEEFDEITREEYEEIMKDQEEIIGDESDHEMI